MDENIHIEDWSGDRKYFTIIPNYILNHSTANDQSLYLHMKRFAGEKGECFASENLLMKKMGIGRMALKKAINYLIEHKWIDEVGHKVVMTKGGIQKIRVYKINDIWKLNTQEYEGVAQNDIPSQGASRIAPLSEQGAAETTRGCVQNSKGGASRMTSKKNHIQEEPIEEDTSKSSDLQGKQSKTFLKGNEWNLLIDAFSVVNPMFRDFYSNRSERAALDTLAQTLTVDKLLGVIQVLEKIIIQPYAPKITKPTELKRDYGKLMAFVYQKREAEQPKKLNFI